MKKILSTVVLVILTSFIMVGCTDVSSSVVRIHIRANSNSECDQAIKLKVRDEIINYITPLLVECNNAEDVKNTLSLNLNNIENVSNGVLEKNNFNYTSNAKINYEYFPSREYNGEVYPADFYDALIIELGSGKGDNWWCVAYPPLCFVVEEDNTTNIKYKSKILEMINDFFGE